MSVTPPLIQSIRTKLSNLAKTQGIQFPHAMTLFLLERAVVRLLMDDLLARHLVFKGGYVGVRVYNSPRHTTDLDALTHGLPSDVAEARIKAALALSVDDGCWFEFEERAELKTQGEYGGIRFAYRAGLGERPKRLSMAQIVNLDLGIGDPVTPAPRAVTTPLTLGQGHLSWQVYPIETVLAEKLHALTTIGSRNSRSKDVFDISIFLPQASKESLHAALEATFAFRGDPLPPNLSAVLQALDTESLRRGWPAAVSALTSPPTFDAAFNAVLQQLARLDL